MTKNFFVILKNVFLFSPKDTSINSNNANNNIVFGFINFSLACQLPFVQVENQYTWRSIFAFSCFELVVVSIMQENTLR